MCYVTPNKFCQDGSVMPHQVSDCGVVCGGSVREGYVLVNREDIQTYTSLCGQLCDYQTKMFCDPHPLPPQLPVFLMQALVIVQSLVQQQLIGLKSSMLIVFLFLSFSY